MARRRSQDPGTEHHLVRDPGQEEQVHHQEGDVSQDSGPERRDDDEACAIGERSRGTAAWRATSQADVFKSRPRAPGLG